MGKRISLAIVGASGAVGREIIRLLMQRNFPVQEIKFFGSDRSAGKKILFKDEYVQVQKMEKKCLKGIDITFFCAGSAISKAFAQEVQESGSIMIDNSSAFRMDKEVPLIIPEINLQDLYSHKGIIANPNCSTIIMLMALYPLHKVAPIKRIVAATYQAASGAGSNGMIDLIEDTKAHLQNQQYTRRVIPFPYAFNLFLHNSRLHPNGYNDEELKMIQETKKILQDDSIKISSTCVRVPVLRCHSEALNVEFSKELSAKQAKQILAQTQGLILLEDRLSNHFAMPIDAAGKNEVFCGRIREDLSQKNTLDLWVVADQLLKGAALNAVQIAEHLYTRCPGKNAGEEEKHSSCSVIG